MTSQTSLCFCMSDVGSLTKNDSYVPILLPEAYIISDTPYNHST